MSKSIIVIGGGIAGLATGCYGRMNGYDTHIFEMHDKPGGLCTSWKRNGYTFDGCIHWLVGTKPGTPFNKVWTELGALQNRKIVDHGEFTRVEGPQGKTLIVYTNIDELVEHLKTLSPKDSQMIEEFGKKIRHFGNMETPIDQPSGLEGLRLLFKMIPFMKGFMKLGTTSIQDFAKSFTDPFLRRIFPLLFDLPDFPILGALSTLGWLDDHNAGYPIGGSLEMSKAIEHRYLNLGGELHYRSRVEKILVEDGRAVGVRLADGTEQRGDVVVSAADGHSTIFDMLDGAYLNETITGYYEYLQPFPPIIQVSLGIARDLSSEPHSMSFPTEGPVIIAGRTVSRLNYKHYCYDPTMAPPGKSVLTSLFVTDYEYWKSLHKDEDKYEAEKKQIAATFIEELNKRLPGIREDIEVVDVATPITFERYTGNWRASFEGWLLTTETSKFMVREMENTLPGLQNFYMVGQWVHPGGGLPPAALSGRVVIQNICKGDKKKFTTSTP